MSGETDWSCDAREALEIEFLSRDGSKTQFSPLYMYPIFGEEETIFGYSGLRIKLQYQSDTLKPTLKITYKKKYTPQGDTKADELEAALEPFIPAHFEPSLPAEQELADAQPFTPPGKSIHQYTRDGRKYSVFTSTLADAKTKELIRRVQTLIPMFIEGGTLIDLDIADWTLPRWTIFFLYDTTSHPSLIGYSTAYRLFYLPEPLPTPPSTPTTTAPEDFDADTFSLPQRQRISQFLILPPYQTAGHGSRLYNAVWSHFHADPSITEISVEDPNEAFDDMRDVNDLLRLRTSQPSFTALTLNPNTPIPDPAAPFPRHAVLPAAPAARARADAKIADRQFDRLVEMHTLAAIPTPHRSAARITRKERASDPLDRAYWFWRMLVRRRLYVHNRDALAQMSWEERMAEMDKVLQVVEDDYQRLLGLADARARHARERDETEVAKAGRARMGKRRVVADDDEEDEDEAAGRAASGKRPRVEA